MADRRQEERLSRTAAARGSSNDRNEEVEAMRDLESMSNMPPELVDVTALPQVRRALDPAAAIPSNAPESVKRSMSDRMARYKAEADRPVPGETGDRRRARLHSLREELWPDGGCDCNGTGLITKRGVLRSRRGRAVPNSTWVTACECPHGQARRDSEASPGKDVGPRDGDGLEDVF